MLYGCESTTNQASLIETYFEHVNLKIDFIEHGCTHLGFPFRQKDGKVIVWSQ